MLWMTDSEIYRSYSQAEDKNEQLSILCQLNACTRNELMDAIHRYSSYVDGKQKAYELAKDKSPERVKKRTYSSIHDSKERVRVMIQQNPEPICGIVSKKPSFIGIKQKNESVNTPSKETKLRWRKRTKIVNDYDVEWNELIDSMRMHQEMAKECEKQLIQLEKTHGSKRRKENRIK